VTDSFSGSSRPVELRPAGVHAAGEFCFRYFFSLHQIVELPGKDAFDGTRGYLFINSHLA